MSMQDSQSTRRQVPEAAAGRRALAVVQPFLPQLEQWNSRAAKISGMLLSHLLSEGEKARQRELLGALVEEVEAGQILFEEAVEHEPRHGRIADVRAAFDRLLSILRNIG